MKLTLLTRKAGSTLTEGIRSKPLMVFSLKAVLTVGLYYLIIRQLNFTAVKTEVKHMHRGYLLAAYLFMHTGYLFSTARMRTYWQDLGVQLPWKQALGLYYRAALLNSALPGGIGGDTYRIFYGASHSGIGKLSLLRTILSERLSGLWALGIGMLLLCAFYRAKMATPLEWVTGALAALLGNLFYYYVSKVWLKEAPPITARTGLWSLGVQLASLLGAVCLMLGLHQGTSFPLIPYMILFFASSLASVLPLTLGGMGLREATFLYGSEWLVLDKNLGVVFATLYFILHSTLGLWAFCLPNPTSSKKFS